MTQRQGCRAALWFCAAMLPLFPRLPAQGQSQGTAQAQGIDCARAREPLDRAICASPSLLAQDRAMGAAYRARLERDPDHATALRQSQLQWLRDRRAACLPGRTAPAQAEVTACLSHQFAARLAALAPADAPPTPSPAPAAEAVVKPTPAKPPEPSSPALPVSPVADTPEPLLQAAAPNAPGQTPAAALDSDHLPAAEQAETLLHITQPGRFAIIAKSASGAALELVDMITGPTPRMGEPGSTDGRLDLLLDVGTYKLRAFSAPGATGNVQLRVVPYRDAAALESVPEQGRIDGALADFQQRSFWLAVTDDQPVRLEAAGRALADLRLWRDGRDLVPMRPRTRTIEPAPSHPMNDLVLAGKLPPGTYLVTAYGGPSQTWADGSAAQPFHLRSRPSTAFLPGWIAGHIGPFGSEIFAASPHDDLFRLDMAGPATLAVDGTRSVIARNSREPSTQLRAETTHASRFVEVRGPEGTPFQLRGLALGRANQITRPGSYWVTANTTGLGGDEPPATVVLARLGTVAENGRRVVDVLGAEAPEVGPGKAWRRRFNIRAPVTLVVHVTGSGPLTAHVTGVTPAEIRLMALGSESIVPPAANAQTTWDVQAGWYVLRLVTDPRNTGIADLTLGPPGMQAEIGAPQPSSPSFSFGIQQARPHEQLVLFSNVAAGAAVAMDARPLPVALADDPLRITQAAGQALDVPVSLPPDGTLAALEMGAGPIAAPFAVTAGAARTGTVHLAAADHSRMVALYWQAPSSTAPVPPPRPEAALETLQDRTSRFLNLNDGEQRSYMLDVRQGGLFRVETLGRLHTSGAIGTHFIPELQTAEANGIGQNMLMEGWLRAGRYHVDVAATGSSGHLGLTASPAPLLTAAGLLPGGTVRARLPAGSGVIIPIDIAETGTYQLDLLGLGRTFSARLEDAEGWPIQAAGRLDTLTRPFEAGHYRLLVLPQPTEARAVARLTRQQAAPALSGHGPHKLPFGDPQSFTWREPAGRDDPRQPDVWTFTLAAPADVTLSIGDGMAAVVKPDGDGKTTATGRLTGDKPFSDRLPAGAYRVEAASQGRNDRLDYTLELKAKQLQPDVARTVDLPSTVSFTLAQDRVVSLTSFGGVAVRATLRDASGKVVGRFGGRDDDWNIALSRYLHAGSYMLDVASAAPPTGRATPPNVNDVAGASPDDSVATSDDSESGGDDSTDTSENGQDQRQLQKATLPDAADTSSDSDSPDSSGGNTASDDQSADAHGEGGDTPQTELLLSLPTDVAPIAAPDGVMTLPGGGVHRLTLPQPKPGQLLLAAASSSTAAVLSLERQDSAGIWQAIASDQGLTPLVAVPADAAAGAWRVSVWPVDGGKLPMQVAVRLIDQTAVDGSQPRFVPVALPGVADGLGVAHVALPTRGLLALTGAEEGLLAGQWPGHAATPPQAGLLVPQAGDLWLVARKPSTLTLVPLPPGTPVQMSLQAGGVATLAAQPGGDRLPAWIADSGQGQPGLDGGHGMGVAPASAFALAGTGTLRVWNAGGAEALRVALRPVALSMSTARAVDGLLSETLPPASALPLTLPEGHHALRLDLAPGTAAIAGWRGADAVTVWTGQDAVSRTLEGGWTDLLLVNTGTAPAAVALGADTADKTVSIQPDRPLKRFFGAAGSIDLPVQAVAGQRLIVAGDGAATFTSTGGTGAEGRVLRGTAITLPGPGRVVFTHGIGLLAAWLEGEGTAPWPAPAPQTTALPQTVDLSGSAMLLALSPQTPVLLRARSTAPVILSLDAGEGGRPMLFAAGATLNTYLPAGPARLHVISPHDGPLSGTLELRAAPVRPAPEGLGDPVALAPGDAALFGFTLAAPSRIGVGVRAEPDRVSVRLLDGNGKQLAEGVALLRDLPAGRYLLEAQVPPDAPTTIVRPAVVGTTPRPTGPPPDVVRTYLELAGMAPEGPKP